MYKELTKSKRNLILFTVSIATFMATLDGSIVSIAMPVISKAFSVNIGALQWILTSYLLTISAFLLIWGKLSDLYGRKYFFAAGIAIFTLGSLMCGLSGSLSMLILSRIIQALGASITMALSQGIITAIFPPNERGRVLGMTGTVVAVGSLTGPSLGGILVHLFGWQTIFFVNIPFGILGTCLTLLIMPTLHIAKEKQKFDYSGALLFMASILLFFTALLFMQDGMISLGIMAFMIGIALILFVVFLKNEGTVRDPILDLTLFHNPIFSTGLICSYFSFVAMFSYIFLMPFYLQNVLELNILKAGLLMSLYPATTAIIAPFSGWLSDKISFKPLTILGFSITSITFLLLSSAGIDTPLYQVGILIVLLGFGGAVFQSPNTSSVMGAAPKDKLGIAGSISAFFRNFGMVSGTSLAVLLFIFTTKMGIENVAESLTNPTIFLKGFKIVLEFSAGLSLAGLLLSAFRFRIAIK